MDPVSHPQAVGQGLQPFFLRPVPRDEEADIRGLLPGGGEAPHQGLDILHRVQPGGDAHIDRSRLIRHPVGPEEFPPGHRLPGPVEIHAVVDGVDPVRLGHAPLNEQGAHGIAHPDEIIHVPEGHEVQLAEGHGRQGAAHIVQLPVAVDRGDQGQAGGPLQEPGHKVAPAAVAVDQVEALLPDHGPELLQHRPQVPAGENGDIDAHLPGGVGEIRLHKAHQLHGDVAAQGFQQAQPPLIRVRIFMRVSLLPACRKPENRV